MRSSSDAVPSHVSTGVAGLDHLLHGGILRGNSLLLEGPPGSGKSTLGLRIVHEGIVRHREPALVIAFEEFPRQIYREALATGVDLRAHEASGMLRVLWTPPARILAGFRGHDDLLDRLLRELGVKRLLLDSITHFKRIAPSETELREILSDVLCSLKLRGVTSFLVKELETADASRLSFEEYLVDASVRLHHRPDVLSPAGGARLLEVRKTRGQGHVPGRHPFTLERDGFRVYPRLRAADVERLVHPAATGTPALRSTGDAGLDVLVSGGFREAALSLVVGPSGAGKTSLALQFLDAGLAAGERVLLVALKDRPADVLGRGLAAGTGWAEALATGRLRLLDFEPGATSLEEMQVRTLRAVDRMRPTRIVVDGLDDARVAAADAASVRDHVAVLARLAVVAPAAVLLTASEDAAAADGAFDPTRAASCVVRLAVRVRGDEIERLAWAAKAPGPAQTRLARYELDGLSVTVRGATDEAPRPRAVDLPADLDLPASVR